MKRFLRASNFAALLLLLGGETAATVSTHHALYLLGTLAATPSVAYLIATRRKPGVTVPPRPAPPAPAPRYPDGAPEGTCPICGMDDTERFALGIGEDDWRGHPAHTACVEWLGDWEPPRKAVDRGRQMLPLGAATWTYGSTAGTILGTNVAAGAGGGGAGGAGGGIILNYVFGASLAEAAILSSFGVPAPMMGTATTIRRSPFEHEPWPLNLPRAGSTMPATTPGLTGYGSDGLPGIYATSAAMEYARGFKPAVLRDLSQRVCDSEHRAITAEDLHDALARALVAAGTFCLCGQIFCGTAAEISKGMRAHRKSGQCTVQEQARRYWAKGGGPP